MKMIYINGRLLVPDGAIKMDSKSDFFFKKGKLHLHFSLKANDHIVVIKTFLGTIYSSKCYRTSNLISANTPIDLYRKGHAVAVAPKKFEEGLRAV